MSLFSTPLTSGAAPMPALSAPVLLQPEAVLAHADSATPWPADAIAAADVAASYRGALAVRALRIARGERPCGFKIGFTNRGLWPRYGVAAPIWGTVWGGTLVSCDAATGDDGDGGVDTAVVDLRGTCEPRIEPECVFGIARTPPAAADTDLTALFNCLDWVAPGFEIVQSHRPGWRFSAADAIADGGLHARLVVGRRHAVRSVSGDDADAFAARLAGCRVRLLRGPAASRGGDAVRPGFTGGGSPTPVGAADAEAEPVTEIETGRGTNVLDGPLQALQHFVRELRACPGAPALQPGDVVTTGTWTDAWPVAVGERWRADFDAPLSASLAVRFTHSGSQQNL